MRAVELLLSYFIGGFTFLPLSLLALLLLLHYSSPYIPPTTYPKTGLPTVEDEIEPSLLYRQGWLTIRRSYDSIDQLPGSGYVGMMVSGYRTFMDSRSNDPRRSKPKHSFFAVLDNTTLKLYTTQDLSELATTINLSTMRVLIYPQDTIDGELFVKRNAICLTSSDLDPSSHHTPTDATVSDQSSILPYFIFAKVNSDKEDWYHDFLRASKLTKKDSKQIIARDKAIFELSDMATLIAKIDQQPDSIPSRWLNAFIGRIFLGVYRTATIEEYLIARIVRKLKRVKIPSILSEIKVKEVNVGTTAPFFTKPLLKELTPEGVAAIELSLSYVGNFRITIETIATINLGSHFKPYVVRLVLAVVLKELEGQLLLKIKPSPSNRVWFGFSSMPRMVLEVEPVVSTRKINFSLITSPIITRIREVIMESIVVPHMDDFPFFDSTDFLNRGGIFGDALRTESTSTPIDSLIPSEPTNEEINDSESTTTLHVDSTSAAEDTGLRQRTRVTENDANEEKVERNSLAGFSIAAWSSRDKDNTSAERGATGEKRRSWFPTTTTNSTNRQSTAASATPPLSSHSSVTTLRSNLNNGGDMKGSGSGEESDGKISAARLRDVLQRRAKEREEEEAKEVITPPSVAAVEEEERPNLSALSLTAPKSNSSIDVANIASEPIINVDDSLLSSNRGLSTSLPTSSSSPPLAKTSLARPSFSKTSDLPPPPTVASRTRHNPTASLDSAFVSTSPVPAGTSTQALLQAWRTKTADKQAVLLAATQAKEGLKRWGATWKTTRPSHSTMGSSNSVTSSLLGVGREEVVMSGEEESYKDFLAGKSRSVTPSTSIGIVAPSSSALSTSRDSSPVSISTLNSVGAVAAAGGGGGGKRKVSLVGQGHFIPAIAGPTTSITTPASSSPLQELSLSSTTPASTSVMGAPEKATPTTKVYAGSKMMVIPGIRDAELKKAVAEDHLAAPTSGTVVVAAETEGVENEV